MTDTLINEPCVFCRKNNEKIVDLSQAIVDHISHALTHTQINLHLALSDSQLQIIKDLISNYEASRG